MSSSDLQRRIEELTQKLVTVTTRAERRDINVELNQLRQQQWAEQRADSHADRLARQEENRQQWAEQRAIGFAVKAEQRRFDQHTLDMAAKFRHLADHPNPIPGYQPGDIGCTPQEFLDWQERQRKGMTAKPGDSADGGLADALSRAHVVGERRSHDA